MAHTYTELKATNQELFILIKKTGEKCDCSNIDKC